MTSPLGDRQRLEFRDVSRVAETREEHLRREGFTVGKWRVEPRRHRIVSGEVSENEASREIERPLDPRSMSVLIALAAAPGEVVTRDELLDTVWGDVHVSENSLSKAVSRLRQALGDEPSAPRYIETHSRSGYRLVARVGPVPRSLGVAGVEEVVGQKTEPAVERVEQRLEEDASAVAVAVAAREAATHELAAPRERRWVWAIFGVVLLAAVVSAWWILSGRSATVPPPLPRIRPEVTLVGNQFGPRLSPDGEHVAFAWRQEGSETGWDIWVQTIGGDQPVQVTDHPFDERLATWSPDGHRLAFVRFSETEGTCGIFATPLLGVADERLADCARGMRSLALSPDGRWLAHDGFSAEGSQVRALFLVELATGERRQLTEPPEGILGDVGARFSPDGTRLAFEREIGPFRHDVALVSIEDGETRMLTADRWGQVRGVDWSSDGGSVVFSSNRVGQFALWRVPAEGGEPERVPILDTWVTQPSVSRAGGRLIYRTFRDSVDVWEVPLDGEGVAAGEPMRRVASSRSERQAVWSPSEDAVVFVSDRSGSTEVWSAVVGGGQMMRHTDLGGPLPASPGWSPDGESIVFDAAVEGHGDLWVVGRQSRRPRRLTFELSEERNGSFSRDGRSLYFASNRGGGWDVWRMPADGGEAQRVTEGGGFFAQESRDGRSLFYAPLDEPGIWRVPVEGGEAELVVGEMDLSDWGGWQVGEGGIYFVRRGPTTVQFAPFDGSAVKVVFAPEKQVPYLERTLSLSPDGGSLLVALIDHGDDEVMTVDWEGH